MAFLAAGRNVHRGFELRVAGREIHDAGVTGDGEVERNPARPAVDRVLVHVIGEEIVAVRQVADDRSGLIFGIVQQIADTFAKGFDAELFDHRVDSALARIHRGDLRLQIAPVLLRHANIGEQDVEDVLIDLPRAHDLCRRQANAFLVNLGQRARQAGGHRAADIRVVDVTDSETHDFAGVEDRLPDMHVRRMGADEAAVRIVGEADIAFLVPVYRPDDIAVIHADEPSGAEFRGGRESVAIGGRQRRGEIFGFLHEGRMRRAIERVGHALGRCDAMVLQYLQGDLVDGHALALPAQYEIAEFVDDGGEASWNTTRCVVLSNDGGAVEALSGAEFRASVDVG